jgi:hypothetical protein
MGSLVILEKKNNFQDSFKVAFSIQYELYKKKNELKLQG